MFSLEVIILYIIGIVLSYKFFYGFFSRDRLTDNQFTACITFFSIIWPFILIFWFGVLIIAPALCLIISWPFFMIMQPKETWKDTKTIIHAVNNYFLK